MKYSSVLKPYFRDIEAAGGYGSCQTHFRRAGQVAGSDREIISGMRFVVEILVPFQHAGNSLIAIGKGEHRTRTQYSVRSIDDLEYHIQRGRMWALKEAVHNLREDIQQQMVQVRPTTSLKKQRRKVGTVLRRINADGLVDT